MWNWSQADLEQLDWRDIKEIAEKLGIPKPESGWLEAIPLILEFQSKQSFLNLESASESTPNQITQINTVPEVIPAVDNQKLAESKFSTDFYEATKISYCPVCGEKKRFFYGQPVCPVNNSICPMK